MTARVEKPPRDEAPSNLTIVGRYLFTPRIFEFLRRTKPGRNGEIQLTDAIAQLAASETVLGLEFEGRRYDTGDPAGFLEATIEYALRSEDAPQIRAYIKALAERL